MSIAVLNLPRLERYALAAMLDLCGRAPGDRPTAEALAEHIGAPPAMLAKVLRRLVVAGLVESTRGHRGGYWLDRPAETIFLAEVLGAVEDEHHVKDAGMECALGVRACDPGRPCRLHDRWAAATRDLRGLLYGVTLSEIAAGEIAAGEIAASESAAR